MSLLFPLILVASPTLAQLTTSVWYLNPVDAPLVGSVIGLSNGLTTIAADPLNVVFYKETMTFGGLTYAAFTVTAYAYLFDGRPRAGPGKTKIIEQLACSRTDTAADATAVCEHSTVGAKATLAEDCSRYAVSAVWTTTATATLELKTAKPTVVTEVVTVDYRTSGLAYCVESGGVPESAVAGTMTLAKGEETALGTVSLILTAGLEKLGLEDSGAATVTSGGVASASGSASESGSANVSQRSGSAGSAQSGSTGAAASVISTAPALLGMGAAAMALFT